MSLFITCEAGGDAIPQWLVPELRTLGQRKKNRRSPKSPRRRTKRKSPDSNSPLKNRTAEDASGVNADGVNRLPKNAAIERLKQNLKVDRHGVEISRQIAAALHVPSCFNPFPIDLVDVTKDVKQRNLFAGPFRTLKREAQQRLLNEVHQPYFERVCRSIETLLNTNDFVIHFSLRTFPLRNKGTIRRTDVGLLYDSSKSDEVDLCSDLVDDMWYRAPMLKVRRNYPRRGSEIGITRQLRKRFASRDYIGVELWLNRAWAARRVSLRDEAIHAMTSSIAAVTGLADLPLQDDSDFYDAA